MSTYDSEKVRLCDIWVPDKCSSTFATQTFASDRLLLVHNATQDIWSWDNCFSDICSSTFSKPHKSLCSSDICYLRQMLFKTFAIQTFAISTFALLFFKVLLYLFTSFPCKLCLNRSTIKTDMQEMASDMVTCWAKGYCVVVLYVFWQLGLRQNICVIFVSCTNTFQNLLMPNLYYIYINCASS